MTVIIIIYILSYHNTVSIMDHNHIAVLTLNSPGNFNALSDDMLAALAPLGAQVRDVRLIEPSLEDMFFELIERRDSDAVAVGA
mgnify:CR=1 FL=1